MNWGGLLRRALWLIVVPLFVASLLAVVISGPVVVQREELELSIDVSPMRLRRSVEMLCGEFSPRDAIHPDKLDAAASWIAGEMRLAGLRVETPESTQGELRFRNVVGIVPGEASGLGSIVIGAHYDAIPGSAGARDNASGVAVLLELARTLPPHASRRDLYFVAFGGDGEPLAGEETSGSSLFAGSLRARRIEVDLMLSLDQVGSFSERPGSQRFPLPGLRFLYPTKGDFIALVGDLTAGASIKQVKTRMRAARTVPVYSFRVPDWLSVAQPSSQLAFRRLGMPALLVTDPSFMRSPHDPSRDDTPERLNYDRMADLVQALHGVLWDPAASHAP